MKNNQRIIVIIGIVISLVFLWLAFRNLHPEMVLESLANLNIPLVFVGMAIYLLAMLAITWRWQLLLNAIKRISIARLYPLVSIGYMGNNVYPFRSGEILRIVLLNRDEKVPPARAAATVVVERVFDGLVMLMFVIVPLLFVEIASPQIRNAALFTAPFLVIGLLVFLVLAARPQLLTSLAGAVAKLMPAKIGQIGVHLAHEVTEGLAGLRSLRGVLLVFLASTLSWAIEASVYWLVGVAFGLNVSYPIMLIVVGTVNLAGLIPASPGQIGVFEFFASLVLVAVGVAEDQALAFALLVHIVIWLPPTLLGFILLARRGLGFGAVRHARDLEKQIENKPA